MIKRLFCFIFLLVFMFSGCGRAPERYGSEIDGTVHRGDAEDAEFRRRFLGKVP